MSDFLIFHEAFKIDISLDQVTTIGHNMHALTLTRTQEMSKIKLGSGNKADELKETADADQ